MATRDRDCNTSADVMAARWSSLCERFYEIRLGASRHNLSEDLRQLMSANAATPGLLDKWEQLDRRILALDADEDTRSTRLGSRPDEAGEKDEWDELTTEYICPARRCNRHEFPYAGVVPRCGLLGTEMTPRAGNHFKMP